MPWQKAFLQSPCFKPRRCCAARLTRKRRLSKRRTGAKQSHFDQSRPSRLPKTTIRDLARSGLRFLSFLIVKTHIVGMALGAPFSQKGSVLTQRDTFKGAETLDSILFLIVALKPDFTIGMSCGKGLKEGRWAIPMEIDSADDVGHGIKHSSRRRGFRRNRNQRTADK